MMKGEKGIKILAPSPFKVKQEMEKIDPATQKPVIGADGNPVTEEKKSQYLPLRWYLSLTCRRPRERKSQTLPWIC